MKLFFYIKHHIALPLLQIWKSFFFFFFSKLRGWQTEMMFHIWHAWKTRVFMMITVGSTGRPVWHKIIVIFFQTPLMSVKLSLITEDNRVDTEQICTTLCSGDLACGCRCGWLLTGRDQLCFDQICRVGSDCFSFSTQDPVMVDILP